MSSQLGDNLTGIKTPEIPDQTGPWFNSNPTKISALSEQSKIVLIDFWTYSCVNCLRTLPYVKKWHEKYASAGLVIIGIHTPEFEFEKDPKNVEKFIKREQIDYPVVMDNDYKIWHAFTNHYWPRKFLIDTKGTIRYDHAGEGSYEETESVIQTLIKEASNVAMPNIETEHKHLKQGTVCYSMTSEIYAGYLRGVFGNDSGALEDKKSKYKSPEIADYSDGKIYLEGEWLATDEFLQHARSTSDPDDFTAIRYHGLEVNAVLKVGDNSSYKVFVQRDGKPLEKSFAGKNIEFDPSGMSFVEVREPKLYNLIKDKDYGEHILKLTTLSDQMQLFAYTFGGCAE